MPNTKTRGCRAALGGAEIGRGGQGIIETMDRLPDFVHGAEEVQLVYVDLRTGAERRKDVSTRLLASMVPGAVFKLPLEEDRKRTGYGRPVFGGGDDDDSVAAIKGKGDGLRPNVNNADDRAGTYDGDMKTNASDVAGSYLKTNAKNAKNAAVINTDRWSPTNDGVGPSIPAPIPVPIAEEERPHRRNDPIRDEFEGNLLLANTIALGNIGRRKHVRVLSINTPFLVREDRFMVIGVIAGGDEDGDYLPIYRRMGGNLDDFTKRFPQDATLTLALEATRACLDVAELLISVGGHHCDIKEENMLYDVVCGEDHRNGRNIRHRHGRRSTYPPPCRVDFAVSDFGLVRIRPSHVSNRGTPGSICPLTYENDDKGRSEYVADHILSSRVASADDVWASYERERTSKTVRATSPSAVHEKSDLFAVGVMLLRFAKLGQRTAGDSSRSASRTDASDPGQEPIEAFAAARDFAIKLIRGDRGSIWTIERAQKVLSKLMSPIANAPPVRTRSTKKTKKSRGEEEAQDPMIKLRPRRRTQTRIPG